MTARSKPANAKGKAKTPTKTYEPTQHERDADARVRDADRAMPRVTSRMVDGQAQIMFDHPDMGYAIALVQDAIGAHDTAIFGGLISQVGNASLNNGEINTDSMNFMLGVMRGIEPKDTVEVMLAAQMAAVQMQTMTRPFRARLDWRMKFDPSSPPRARYCGLHAMRSVQGTVRCHRCGPTSESQSTR
jgi:hypothetical protein